MPLFFFFFWKLHSLISPYFNVFSLPTSPGWFIHASLLLAAATVDLARSSRQYPDVRSRATCCVGKPPQSSVLYLGNRDQKILWVRDP